MTRCRSHSGPRSASSPPPPPPPAPPPRPPSSPPFPAASALATGLHPTRAVSGPAASQGLGINRGFLHVLDAAELVKGYARAVARDGSRASEPALRQLCERREGLFNVTKKISGYNRLTELKPHLDKQNRLAYSHDPRSRCMLTWGSNPRHGRLIRAHAFGPHVGTDVNISAELQPLPV